MTDAAAPTAVPVTGEAEAEAACMACEHPLEEHDTIGLRFCNATVEKALSRGCVCRPR